MENNKLVQILTETQFYLPHWSNKRYKSPVSRNAVNMLIE